MKKNKFNFVPGVKQRYYVKQKIKYKIECNALVETSVKFSGDLRRLLESGQSRWNAHSDLRIVRGYSYWLYFVICLFEVLVQLQSWIVHVHLGLTKSMAESIPVDIQFLSSFLLFSTLLVVCFLFVLISAWLVVLSLDVIISGVPNI